MAKKKMQKMKCCPDTCPEVGSIYTCGECGFAVKVVTACTCADVNCVSLACCGKPMEKSN